MDEKGSEAITALCQGCGTCVAACPSAAITGAYFTREQLMAQIEGLLWDVLPGRTRTRPSLALIKQPANAVQEVDTIAETYEPVIIGFLCNWCSYRAADLAARRGLHYAPNMRPIRRCAAGGSNRTWC